MLEAVRQLSLPRFCLRPFDARKILLKCAELSAVRLRVKHGGSLFPLLSMDKRNEGPCRISRPDYPTEWQGHNEREDA